MNRIEIEKQVNSIHIVFFIEIQLELKPWTDQNWFIQSIRCGDYA